MSEANPLEVLMKLGRDWADAVGRHSQAYTPEALDKLWPTLSKEAMEAVIGKGVRPDGLDAKTRMLLTLQGLTIQGAVAEPQIRMTVRHALAAGATRQELIETIALAGVFGGALDLGKSMELLNAVLEESAL